MSWTNYETKKDEWVVDGVAKCVKEKCPEVEKKGNAVISLKAYSQIKTLCQLYPEHEWLAGIVGKIKDGKVVADSLKLFEQKVTGAFCELTDKGNEEKAKADLIGWIHSHNTMSVFQSSKDEETANFNGLSLTVNNKLEFFGTFRQKLPCGKFGMFEVEVEMESEADKEIEAEAKQYITIPEKTVITEKEYNKDICVYCDNKVGKKKIAVGHGFVHPKCYQKYLKENKLIEEEDDDELTEENGYWTDEFGHVWCGNCQQTIEFCHCRRARDLPIYDMTYY